MYRRLDQPVQEPPAIGSQICLSSDSHCSSHIWSNLWNIFMLWQSEALQLWLLMADSPCTDWSNLRSIVPIYDVYRYGSRNSKGVGELTVCHPDLLLIDLVISSQLATCYCPPNHQRAANSGNLSAARKEATLFDIGFLKCKITSVQYFLFDSMNSIYVDI